MEIAKRFNVDRRTVRNIRDGKRRGRYSKITKEDARQIVICWKAGMRQYEIGEIYGIHQAHVSSIVRGKSWAGIKSKASPPRGPWPTGSPAHE